MYKILSINNRDGQGALICKGFISLGFNWQNQKLEI